MRRNSGATTRTPPSPMIGSIRIAAVSVTDGAPGRFEVAERHLVEALDHGTEAVQVFLLAAGRQRRQGAAVEGALVGDDAVALRPAARRLVLARHLDGALQGLGAGIGEKHHVRETGDAQAGGQPFALRDTVEVGDMPDLAGLLGDRGNQTRMGMAERIHRHPGGKIEVAIAIGGDEPSALPALECQIDARVGGQQMRRAGPVHGSILAGNEMCRLSRRHAEPFYCRAPPCQHAARRDGSALRSPVSAGADSEPRAIRCGREATRGRNVWTRPDRTLAPDSRHIVAFRL